MRRSAAMWVCGLALAAAAGAEQVKCPVTADAWVESPSWSPKGRESRNHGTDANLVVSGRNSYALLAFDMSAVKGMTIQGATLRFRRKPDPVPMTVVGISTLSGAAAWAEAEATYFDARAGRPWSYPGSDIADVIFGIGGSLYAYVKAREAGDGWYEVDVPAAIATALATGDQFGLVFTDEKGQTRTRHGVFSRESADPPVLLVSATRDAGPAPGRVRAMEPRSIEALGRTSLRPGSVVLRFGGARAARYELRYSESPITAANFDAATPAPRYMLDPLAPKPSPIAEANSLHDNVNAVVENLRPGAQYYFAARAVSGAGRSGPVSPLGRHRAYARKWPSLTDSPAPAEAQPASASAAGPLRVWSFPELLKVNPQTGELLERGPVWQGDVKLSGARNEFVAFQVAVESAAPVKNIAVSVEKPLFAECKLPPVFQKTGAVQLYREWMVPDDKITGDARPWYPDPLIPLAGTFDLPAADNAVPRQKVQPVFVDIYIPHDAAPGAHRGVLAVSVAGQPVRRIGVEVNVFPLALPDELSFVVDLNAYGGVNGGYNISRGTPEYHKLLQAYHRVAHLNRTNLEILGYSHTGTTEPEQTPPLEGEGAATKVANWEKWDAHFGPLLSGAAFADLPRAGVPVTNAYLALFENYPGDLRKSYKFNITDRPTTAEEYQQLIRRHGLTAGRIEDGFPSDYQERFMAVVRQFAEHLRERKWLKSKVSVFFNDKYYYKDPSRSRTASGVSWWLLDEPNHHDDYRALSFFGWLAKRALKDYPGTPIIFRTDISYIDYIRDQLPGLMDVDCTSFHLFSKNRYCMDNRNRFGNTYWHYASTNHPRDTNVAMRAWCWRAWAAGADGIVPWNTVRGPEAWERAEPLTVFYTGSKFGLAEPFGCLRLKAFRRGQQDVEYLWLLARKSGWDRDAVAHALAGALDLSEEARQRYEEDAGSISFDQVQDGQLDNLRLRVAAALMGK